MSGTSDQVAQQIAEAEAYVQEKSLQDLISRAINACYASRSENPSVFLSDFFSNEAGSRVIRELRGREVLDSRGNPTVEVDVINQAMRLASRAAAPSGASTGSNEALELRDKDDKSRYLGKGVQQAVANVNDKLSPALAGQDLTDLESCDRIMRETDGTPLKTNIGGNAITAASFALAEAGAAASHIPLWQHLARVFNKDRDISKMEFSIPTPLVNILNGGKHAGGKLKIQEFMIVPKRGIKFTEALRISAEVYHHLGKILSQRYGVSAKNLGDEGGYAPSLNTAEEALSSLEEAISAAGFIVGQDVRLALDCAASEFYDKEQDKYEIEEGKFVTRNELVDYYEKLVDDHPALISIEDPLDEKDYEGWKLFTERLGSRIMVIGDDLYTTNIEYIQQGIENRWANSLLLKVNQIGTISESMDAARMVFEDNGQVVVSHRSGETPGSLIADLAVGIGAGYIKTGATARGERVSKYNRLLVIEEELEEMGLLAIRPSDSSPQEVGESSAEPVESS